MGTSDERLVAADENMREAWAAILADAPRFERVAGDDVVLLSSGYPVALFNPAYVVGEPADPAALVARVVEHYAALDAPFALYFRDAAAPTMAAACEKAGLVEHFQPPLMVLDPIADPPPLPEGVEIVTLDASSADAYAAVLAGGFGFPIEVSRRVFGANLLDAGAYTGFLALADGEPAATSGLYRTGDVAGVYSVATLEPFRRRGIAAAVTWAAVAAGAASGATWGLLQASEAGAPVYTRMGFTMPCRYRQFEPPS